MPLSSKERDALPVEQFAVPGKRMLPIHDATHVKMAWSMVNKTKDLSDRERETAKHRILSKAKSLGLDTSKWDANLQAADENASSISAPIDKDTNKNKAKKEIAAALALMSLSFWKFYLDYFAPDQSENLTNNYDPSQYSSARADNLIDLLNQTTRKRIDAAVAEAKEKGATNAELLDIVRETMAQMSNSRPSLIADTESTAAFGNAATEANKTLGFEKQRWLTQQDEKVRDTHNAMLGQTVNIGSLFTSPSGAMALHPGGFGIPEEDCNCRCYVIPLKKSTSLSVAASADNDNWEAFEKFRKEQADKLVPLFENLFKEQEQLILNNLKTPDVLSIDAMSLDVPNTPGHPNKLPFTGILTRLDTPSDNPPSGSGGKKVILPAAVAEKVLPTLLGMAIDYTPNLDGHEPTRKIGIIDEANIVGNAIHISGFFYASDFPKQVERIQSDVKKLGFSWELKNIYVEDVEADPWVITDCVFTGAAVLQKDKAAYITTSLAASAEGELNMATIEELMKVMTDLASKVDKLEASSKPTELSAAHAIPAMVAPHTAKLRAAADGMEAAGIGCHASAGHVATLRAMADSMDADANKGIVPSTWAGSGNGSVWGSAQQLQAAAQAAAVPNKELAEIKDVLASLGTQIKDMQAAAAATATVTPERKTLSPAITTLLAKSGLTMPEGDNKLSIAQLEASMKTANLPTSKRLELKAALSQSGVLGA